MSRPLYLINLLFSLLLLLFFSGDCQAARAARKPVALEVHQPPPAQVLELKHWSNPDYTRVVVSVERDVTWKSHELDKGDKQPGKPGRIFIDLQNTKLGPSLRDISIGDGLLKGVRTALFKPGVVRVVLDIDSIHDYKIFPLSDPARLIIDVRGNRRAEIGKLEKELSSRPPQIPASASGAEPQKELAAVEPPLPPAKQQPIAKIRRIVLDPGHGGHDPGAVGASGLQEKDITLSIGLKLRDKLKEKLGLDVVMTRATDIFIPLEERTAIANKVNGDLFISIHVNAAQNRNATGIETYYLNLAKTEKVAQLAAKENGTTLEKVTTLQAVLFDLMANYKLNDSAHLAEEIQKALYKATRGKFAETRNLGVKQGPFYVLVGATMPSILTEVGFISNSGEEARLSDPSYHDLTADGILEGVRGYISSLK